MTRACFLLLALAACGKGSDAPVGHATGSGSAGSAGSAVAIAADAAAGSAAVASVSAHVISARCDEPCLFLVDTPLEDVPGAYKTACAKDIAGFGFDDCKQLDYARNCIYAAHGKVYKKKKWKKQFVKKPWYAADPSFVESSFTPLEKANVHELYVRGKACKKGIHVSAVDHDRIAAWFAVLPKTPPLPPLTFGMTGEKVSGAEFVKQLQDEFRDELAINHKIDPKNATLTYPTFENDAADMDFVKPLLAALPGDPKSLHPVLVEFALPENTSTEATVNEGTYVVFIYDAKNTLVGMAFDHYLYD